MLSSGGLCMKANEYKYICSILFIYNLLRMQLNYILI